MARSRSGTPDGAGDAAAAPAPVITSPPPLRAVALPSEIIEQILLESTQSQTLSPRNPYDRIMGHGVLRAASLVSKQWGAVAQRLLYARLELRWELPSAKKLRRTFEENPNLYGQVKTFITSFTDLQDWDDDWCNSDEREVAIEEADLLYPEQTLNEQEEYGDDHEAYVENRGRHAAVVAGVAPWLRVESPGRQDGSNACWRFISKLSNLRELSMCGMNMPIRASLLERLRPVLADLTTVGLHTRHDVALSIPPLLHSVETLYLAASRDRLASILPPPPPTNRPRRLKHMRAYAFDDLSRFGLDFTNLVGLSLLNIPGPELLSFTCNILPSLDHLDLLSIREERRIPLVEEVVSDLCEALSHTTITRLYLNRWLTAHQLSHLPPTLSTLDFGAPELSLAEVIELVHSRHIATLKEDYLPGLEKVAIKGPYKSTYYPNAVEMSESKEWLRVRKALEASVTTFELKIIGEYETVEVPGPWSKL
ncbi:hypothetical protein RQP46_001726 [Phenoliferia psychrophenolica]